MEKVTIFQNPQFGDIRTVGTAEHPMFCLTDVCKALGLSNASQVKTRLNQRGTQLVDLSGVFEKDPVRIRQLGNRLTTFIDEPNLYKVIFMSRKKEAEEFQEWVTSEVLPSIRKTGQYFIRKGNNVISGRHTPIQAFIDGSPVMTVTIDGVTYYRLGDILKAAGVYERKRNKSSVWWFKPYVVWIDDQTSPKGKRYVTKDGVVIFLSRITPKQGQPTKFLKSFSEITAAPDRLLPSGYELGSIDLGKLLDIIILIEDKDIRKFLLDIYKQLQP